MRPLAYALCLTVSLALPGAEPSTQGLQSVQLATAANPSGLRLQYSGSLRRTFDWRTPDEPWSSLEGGALLTATPAFGRVGVFAEWQPLPIAVLRVEGSQLRYSGHYGGVLSFAHANDPFGASVLQARRGEEEAAGARQTLASLTFQYQTGALVMRAPVTLLWTRSSGRGPWYYDPFYDTLLRDGDRLQEIQLQVGWANQLRMGTLTLGPAGQLLRTREAALERRRAGFFAYLTRRRPVGGLQQPYLALQSGRDLKDPNRTGQTFVELAVGGRLGK